MRVLKKGLYDRIKVGRDQMDICMLHFPDDTIFFCEVDVKNITVIKCFLRCFEVASGLKVNFRKSKVAGIVVQNIEIQRYSVILNCNLMELPFKYLRVLVGDNYRIKFFWNNMILKIKSKLTTWKENTYFLPVKSHC